MFVFLFLVLMVVSFQIVEMVFYLDLIIEVWDIFCVIGNFVWFGFLEVLEIVLLIVGEIEYLICYYWLVEGFVFWLEFQIDGCLVEMCECVFVLYFLVSFLVVDGMLIIVVGMFEVMNCDLDDWMVMLLYEYVYQMQDVMFGVW